MTFFRSRIGSALRATRSAWQARMIATLLATIALTLTVGMVHAATTTPQTMVYNARLLTGAGTPITTPHTVRFSFWKSADEDSTDVSGTGAINISAANYAGWKEKQTVTPDSNGYFSVQLGSGTALPSMDSLPASTLMNLFLQVEVKDAPADDSTYEILDTRPLDPAVDRSPILSVPFALNADRLDQHDAGTGSGSIPVLGSGGLLSRANVPPGTNADAFTLDSDDTAGSAITLRFGDTLNKTLLYNIASNRFEFNADVNIGGNLTVTGLINGVDLNTLVTNSGGSSPLLTTSGGGLQVRVAGGGYRLNGNVTDFGGTSATLPDNSDTYLFFTGTGFVARASGFPDNVSFIPVAKVTTSGGTVTAITDHRVMQSDDRENSILNVLHPGYADAAYVPDATDNVGQLAVTHDGTSKNNYYLWTSTRGTLQDYDIVVKTTLPQHFVRWQTNPVTLNYRTTSASAADSAVDVSIYDTAGNPATIAGGTSLTSTSWAASGITFTGSPTWTAGQTYLIKIHVSARNSEEAHIGDLELRYVELQKE